MTCTSCGLIYEQVYSTQSSIHDRNGGFIRTNAPVSEFGNTHLGYPEERHRRRFNQFKMRRLQRMNARWRSREVRLSDLLADVCAQLEIPRAIQDEAVFITKRCLTDRRSGHPIALASLLWAVRRHRHPATRQELVDAWNQFGTVSFQTLCRAQFHVQEIMKRPFPLRLPQDLIPRIISNLRARVDANSQAELTHIEREAVQAVSKHRQHFDSANPASIAASCIYYLARKRRYRLVTQIAVADASGISEMTVRDHWTHWRRLLEGEQ
jgi:transcription initiation factor TFIIIB Brf1 subunit/transcription initiation factor TFIIB